ncbi:MAG: hypothetical protein ACOYMN_13235 [Roseimicrobium sp.]
MLFSQQFFYLLIGLGVLFGLPAFWLFSSAMWPDMTQKARQVAARGLFASFLIGLPVIFLTIVMLTRLGKIGQVGGIIGLIIAGLLAMWSLSGLAGLAAHVGTRLWPDCTGGESWRALWRGGLVVAGSLAIPFIGWYGLLIVMLSIGLGMRVRMWFTAMPQVAAAQDAAPLPASAPPLPQAMV